MGQFSSIEIILIDLWPLYILFLVAFVICIYYCCSYYFKNGSVPVQRNLENGEIREVVYAGIMPVLIDDINNELYFSTSSSGSEEENDTECTICLRPIKIKKAIEDLEYAKIIPCGHKFHRLCLESWENRGNADCPNCRTCFFIHQDFREDSESFD